ncbi:preprotein translocase subunit SecE [Rudaeicoccus suwonensis]|uniref:Protein translocase subunit SecE n=1 Tax=Rudaeicoccus suwonensis TaxID=657409 RepID=A0A561E7K8_9MICO|nr:preprotein translocase subunit SecE [Rudaeicoccus suwonensis]TWE11607.1 preprotein translocase subunit SecE [Rudaeicoccus suwonensis]
MSTSTAPTRGSADDTSAARGIFGKIILFIRQVIDEMRKVVVPTRDELVNYTIALLVFLLLMMAFVVGIDQLIIHAVSWVFA